VGDAGAEVFSGDVAAEEEPFQVDAGVLEIDSDPACDLEHVEVGLLVDQLKHLNPAMIGDAAKDVFELAIIGFGGHELILMFVRTLE